MDTKLESPPLRPVHKRQNTLLQVESLFVSYPLDGREMRAVRDISFDLLEGEILGIVGESASGKSTIAQALTRLTHGKISGKIAFRGLDLLSLTDKEIRKIRGKEISYIFQDPMSALNPTMRIGAQIIEGFLFHNMGNVKEARKRALELLDLVNIKDPSLCMKQFPHQLSGGMRQRVLIAMALMTNPSLIIADEPTTALDVTIQAQILDLLQKMQRSFNISLILITHDLSIVAEISQRMLVIYAGKIIERGATQDVLAHPKHPFTQMLLKTIPRVDLSKSRRLETIPGTPPDLSQPILGCPFKERCPFRMKICDLEPPPNSNTSCWKAI